MKTINFILLNLLIIVNKSNQQDLFKISTIHKLIQNKTYTCDQIIDLFLNRIEKYKNLNAIININVKAREEAKYLDEYYFNNSKLIGKLHCIPTIVKDNIDIKGMSTTAGLKAFQNLFATNDALIIQRLRKQGAIFIAKSNMAELAYFNSNNHIFKEGSSELGGECHNPFNYYKINCGASSSGSAISISSGLAILAIGTDTAGSIINPASLNGIYGLRSQFNLPETDGIMPVFKQQDTVGPMTKYIDDLVLSYSIMINNETIYDEYNNNNNNENENLRISFLNLFFHSFDYGPITINNTTLSHSKYTIYNDYKLLLDKAVVSFESISNLNVSNLNFSLKDLRSKESIFLPLWLETRFNFMNLCLEDQLNKYYFNRLKNVNISDYYPLLPKKLRNFFSVFNSNNCSQDYLDYENMRFNFIKLIDSLFLKYNADVIAIPNRPDFKLEHRNLANFIPPFDFIPSFSDKLAFNLPIGYSKPNLPNEPDGFPAGLILIARSDRIVQAFKIAKLYQMANEENFDKLPSITPLY